MPLNNEKKQETHDKPYRYELRPKKDEAAIKRALGKTAIKGASKDKPKK